LLLVSSMQFAPRVAVKRLNISLARSSIRPKRIDDDDWDARFRLL
jgi:hypothetical protein